MPPIKICFTTNSSPWTKFHGGGQVFVHNIATNLGKRGHDVTVIYTGPLYKRQLLPKPKHYRIAWALFIGYPFTAKLRQLNAICVYSKLKSIHDIKRFDIINSIGSEAFFIPNLCSNIKIPLLVSVEHPQIDTLNSQYKFSKPIQSIMKAIRKREIAITKFVSCRSQGLFAPSEFTKSEIIKYFGLEANKIRVVQHGLSEAMIVEDNQLPQPVADGPLIFFGRLEFQKGVDILLKAYNLLLKRKKLTQMKLIIIGSGPEESKYKRMVKNFGLSEQVTFLGWRSQTEIRKILSEASLCVLPSRSESFGLTIAETLALGVPLVTTNAGSIPEVIDYGAGAWMTEKNNVESLANTMRQAYDNYAESLKKAHHGRMHSINNFSWERAAREYEDFYQIVMKDSLKER